MLLVMELKSFSIFRRAVRQMKSQKPVPFCKIEKLFCISVLSLPKQPTKQTTKQTTMTSTQQTVNVSSAVALFLPAIDAACAEHSTRTVHLLAEHFGFDVNEALEKAGLAPKPMPCLAPPVTTEDPVVEIAHQADRWRQHTQQKLSPVPEEMASEHELKQPDKEQKAQERKLKAEQREALKKEKLQKAAERKEKQRQAVEIKAMRAAERESKREAKEHAKHMKVLARQEKKAAKEEADRAKKAAKAQKAKKAPKIAGAASQEHIDQFDIVDAFAGDTGMAELSPGDQHEADTMNVAVEHSGQEAMQRIREREDAEVGFGRSQRQGDWLLGNDDDAAQ
jgi:flagellar biosynthesis GTPase FlhF